MISQIKHLEQFKQFEHLTVIIKPAEARRRRRPTVREFYPSLKEGFCFVWNRRS